MDWSASKLIRIENGSVGISVTDLRALHRALRRARRRRRPDLVEEARATRERTWWSAVPARVDAAAARLHRLRGRRHADPAVPPGDACRPCCRPSSTCGRCCRGHAHRADRGRVPGAGRRPAAPAARDARPGGPRRTAGGARRGRPCAGRSVGRTSCAHSWSTSRSRPERRPQLSVAVLPFAAGPHIGMQGPFRSWSSPTTPTAASVPRERVRRDGRGPAGTVQAAAGALRAHATRGQPGQRRPPSSRAVATEIS